MKRRTFLKRSLLVVLNAILLSGGTYIYARYIEPRLMRVTKTTIEAAEIPESFDGLRILQFSDTHIGHHYSLEQFKQLIKKINAEACDLVLFTGDLVDEPNKYPHLKEIIPLLSSVRAQLGKYAIFGNHDHGGYGTDAIKTILERSDFQLLMNERADITNSYGDRIVLAGLDDILLGKPDPAKALNGVTDDDFAILLAHEPDIFTKLGDYPFHVQISGHSHGGQVQVPFLGPLYTPPGAKDFYEGWYDHETADKRLYVNRGLGTTREPYRFFSVPEMTVFTLKKIQKP
ncbi:metallophosphoesterase [Bacillus tianshenii]|nr:metallophosphoesterase [Bacillus tianshenii]